MPNGIPEGNIRQHYKIEQIKRYFIFIYACYINIEIILYIYSLKILIPTFVYSSFFIIGSLVILK
jgi:hypothetical protein